MRESKPELLMPAGSLQKLEYAFAFGADAAYLGLPLFSLRARTNEVDLEALHKARQLADKEGKKIYFTANVFARNRKIRPFEEQLDAIMEARPDALIMADPGLMAVARHKYPDVPIHLSVQANAMNWATIKFWKESLGVSRIILSRELHLDEIRRIRDRVPDIELEAFVHGAICIAYSGRCLMSSYMSYRDANQGVCDNSCREKFRLHATDPLKNNNDYFVEDLRDKGQLYPIDEDENGTFLMNARDLCLIEHLKEIIEAGVCSLKVEGRTKSLNYVSLVAQAYRKAIDDAWDKRPFDPQNLTQLHKVSNRGYDTGFMLTRNPSAQAQHYEHSYATNGSHEFGGIFTALETQLPDGYFSVDVRGSLFVGQSCEVSSPGQPHWSGRIKGILDRTLQPKQRVHSGAGIYYLKLDLPFHPKYGILSVVPESEKPAPQRRLQNLRRQMDRINLELMYTLQRRFSLLDQIYKLKTQNNWPLRDDKREGEIKSRLKQISPAPEFKEYHWPVFKSLLESSLQYMLSKTALSLSSEQNKISPPNE